MLTDLDTERLSAYLDGELPPEERAVLEARLAVEPALREELDALRVLVGAVRSLPPRRAPRDYALTPAQARSLAPTRRRWLPTSATFSALSAAAAAFLFIAGGALLFLRASSPFAPTTQTMFVQQEQAVGRTLAPPALAAPGDGDSVGAAVAAAPTATSLPPTWTPVPLELAAGAAEMAPQSPAGAAESAVESETAEAANAAADRQMSLTGTPPVLLFAVPPSTAAAMPTLLLPAPTLAAPAAALLTMAPGVVLMLPATGGQPPATPLPFDMLPTATPSPAMTATAIPSPTSTATSTPLPTTTAAPTTAATSTPLPTLDLRPSALDSPLSAFAILALFIGGAALALLSLLTTLARRRERR